MHVEALTEEGKKLFPLLARFDGFYLVGGTGLAIQIGHRLSIDFDMFSFEPLAEGLLQKVKRVFAGTSLVVTYRSSNQINLLIDNVKFTFFHYPYPVIEPLVNFNKVPVASVLEIAAMKAFALGQRASYKDYVDWAFILREKLVDLPRAVVLAKQKFGGEFNDRLFFGQLLLCEDVTVQKIDFLRDALESAEIDKILRAEVKKYARDT